MRSTRSSASPIDAPGSRRRLSSAGARPSSQLQHVGSLLTVVIVLDGVQAVAAAEAVARGRHLPVQAVVARAAFQDVGAAGVTAAMQFIVTLTTEQPVAALQDR
jgi:hypothetical protein